MGPGLPGDHCRHLAGTSAAVGDKCSALKAGCQDPMARKAGPLCSLSSRDENVELTPSRRS